MNVVILNRADSEFDAPASDLEIIRRATVTPEHPEYQAGKRLLDLLICVGCLPVALPLMLLAALAVAWDSPGPIFFVQERVGKGGRRFKMYKFRTMQANVDQSHHQAYMRAFVKGQTQANTGGSFKPASASQITRVGRFLRLTSLDELPQILNVLKGEMSIIGPRPNLAWEVDEYQLWHHARLEVLPGITGLAQVHGRSSIPFEKIIRYDAEYVAKMSLALDLKILWWTVRLLLRGIGVR
ncbi:MAG: sugar transferase [Anaerolineales bacterium]|nr:sugar transferase [Anaerolineales bacterium]